MKKTLLTLIALLALNSPLAAQEVDPNVVYGADDRLDLYQVQNKKILELADSTVGLFEASDVSLAGALAKLSTRPYGKGYNLCPEEPFYEQSSGAFCSGSLIAPDVLMTAGHCITSAESCKGTKFVFGFGIKKQGQKTDSVAASDVYGCGSLIGREQVNDGADWALIRLDRPVTGHKALAVNRGAALKDGAPILVIGHPAGLPTKVSGGASVRSAAPNGYFTANLDTYGGNSGSAVFSAATGLIEGILVRGENDYVYKGNCRVSNVCTDDGCRGEDVTKIGSVLPNIPKPAVPAAAMRVASFGPTLPQLLEILAASQPDFDQNKN